ncbi:hypothetical protein CMEL01_10372 [Colletotrichum melonis]|uniref:Uncharacterized protein n=1 Tax=Colletotrichum melonis TaxID=1209925 RepID=A0AAI9TXZ6_9PEZI|nr:hypothetical protein CMEL01_10372 [Colletotrichum melonis]
MPSGRVVIVKTSLPLAMVAQIASSYPPIPPLVFNNNWSGGVVGYHVSLTDFEVSSNLSTLKVSGSSPG